MSKGAKATVAIVILMAFILIFGVIAGSANSSRLGIIGLIISVGAIIAFIASWKIPKQADNTTDQR